MRDFPSMDPHDADYMPWRYNFADGPILATALHSGHAVRDELAPYFALDEAGRLREEDPATDILASAFDHNLVALASRFETDLNRSRKKAVYLLPSDAWDLTVWNRTLPPDVLNRSLEAYDSFYRAAHQILLTMRNRHGRFLVLDFHSYNHRRDGLSAPAAAHEGNPDIDVEINAVGRNRWQPVVEALVDLLRDCGHDGRPADVRENIRFKGGHFINWVQSEFPETGCAIAIEFKKTFMNEWTGEIDFDTLSRWRDVLRSGMPSLQEQLFQL